MVFNKIRNKSEIHPWLDFIIDNIYTLVKIIIAY